MKKFLSLSILLFITITSIFAELPDFSYGNIPYGETYENIIKMFEGQNVKIYKREWNDSNYYLDFIAKYNLTLLGNGIRQNTHT